MNNRSQPENEKRCLAAFPQVSHRFCWSVVAGYLHAVPASAESRYAADLATGFVPSALRIRADVLRTPYAAASLLMTGVLDNLGSIYRRSILVPVRWQLRTARTLPGRTATLGQWAEQVHGWRGRARVPDRVLLAMDDQHLLLNLTQDMDLDLLRAHLRTSPVAVLYGAPPPDADGWIGGRAHSIVISLRAHP